MTKICNIIIVCLLSMPVLAENKKPETQLDPLLMAYQREILFLSTYKKELKSKIQTLSQNLGSKVVEAQKELNQMESSWLKMQTNNELLMQKLADIERDYENRKDNKELLNTTIKQAASSLRQEEADSSIALVAQVQQLFSQGIDSLDKAQKVTSEAGIFYSEKGEETKGEIFHVGHIARFAESQGRMAALYPSGGGTFKVWKWLDSSADALKSGEVPADLQFFMFDNPEKEFVAQKEKTSWDVIQSGGLIGMIIILMGLFALAISVLRYFLLQKAECRNEVSIHQALSKIDEDKMDEAQHILINENNAIGRVLNKTLSFLRSEPHKVEDAIMESILKESQLIDRFGVVILVVASVAPLMGLLGTVTGMISTFDIITLYGTGNPKLLSGGISEALVTTMFGLIVAIPALLIGQFLSAKNDKIKSDMEKWALATCNAFKNRGAKN